MDGRTEIARSPLELATDQADLRSEPRSDLAWGGASDLQRVTGEYEVLASKRQQNTYAANSRAVVFVGAEGRLLAAECRVFDNGFGLRYLLGPGGSEPGVIKGAPAARFGGAETRPFRQVTQSPGLPAIHGEGPTLQAGLGWRPDCVRPPSTPTPRRKTP